jgi:BirA family biotin operon repressor/biotin-[acetyl-CoA-carboxylase] ligase
MRDKILSLLKKDPLSYLSGEDISNILGISRTAVWKHVNSLKEEGYVIDSITKLGYRLIRVPDRLYEAEISGFLDTESFGRNIVYFNKVDSTNIVARKLAEEGAEHGTVVVAEEQTAGRGRLGRNWKSSLGTGIWMTVIMRPQIIPAEAPKITLTSAVAVAEAISECSTLSPKIKWPNDIMINGKKVCGILTEIKADIDCIHYVVVGIGININQESFPDELAQTATSLRIEGEKTYERVKIAGMMLNQLEKWYLSLMDKGFGEIRDRWKEYSINLGRHVYVNNMKEAIEGIAVDIDQNGFLVVKDATGTVHTISAGDVTLRRT